MIAQRVHIYDPSSRELTLADGEVRQAPHELHGMHRPNYLALLVRVWASSSGWIAPDEDVAVYQ